MLENAIDQLTGINELMTGGANEHSRTPAAETNARLAAGQNNVNTIALDLEQNFLIPILQKVFARVLQFGMNELQSNPELMALFSEEELYNLNQISTRGRFEVLNMWYRFKIKGFSSKSDTNEKLMRMNELLNIANGPGPLSQLINLPEFMKEYFDALGIKEPDRLLMMTNSPLVMVNAENQALMGGHMVIPNQMDDHNFHLQMQGPLAQSPYATPEMQQHAMMHQQALAQMEAMQAQAAEGGAPAGPQQGQVQ
jgi:hypothetical protein